MSVLPEASALNDLALEALETSRRALMVSYRFMDRALWKMAFAESDQIELLGTNGIDLFYQPQAIAVRYMTDVSEAARDFLHVVMHCIFYHPFVGARVDASLWDLSCDIIVEEACMDLAGERFASAADAQRSDVIKILKKRYGIISAEKLYRRIKRGMLAGFPVEELSELFHRDDHIPWYHAERDEQEQQGGDAEQDESPDSPDEAGGDDKTQQSNGFAPSPDDEDEGESDAEQQPQDGEGDEGDEGGEDPGNDGDDVSEMPEYEQSDAQKDWESISKQIKVDLETRSQRYGSRAGDLVQLVTLANRQRYDYRRFLHRFASLDEELVINDSEFDLIYYTYGLSRYGNMPLIEPLEQRELTRIRDFVIAIDTSGSVNGELVKRFVEETFSMLMSAETFFEKVHIRIMQCDTIIQNEAVLTCKEDLDRYLEGFTLKGFGGTDFRPVFRRVDELLEQEAFERLKGVVYFTDGIGRYPEKPPAYDTVFVFVNGQGVNPQIPPWAMKLVLDPDDIGYVEADEPQDVTINGDGVSVSGYLSSMGIISRKEPTE